MSIEHCLFSTVTNQIATDVHLELLELFLESSSLGHLEDIEPHGLAEGSALADYHDVANCDIPENRSQFSPKIKQVKTARHEILFILYKIELHQLCLAAFSSTPCELRRPS